MNKLEKKCIARAIEIIRQGEKEMLSLSTAKDDSFVREMKHIATTGTLGNKVYNQFTEARDWLETILESKND